MHEAVRWSHQSVPQTHVPAEWKRTKLPFIHSFNILNKLRYCCRPEHSQIIWKRLECFNSPQSAALDWSGGVGGGVSGTCCLLKDLQWRWGRRSPRRQSHELSCCGTATSGREKPRQRLVIVTVIEKQEESLQKWEWQEENERWDTEVDWTDKKKKRTGCKTIAAWLSYQEGFGCIPTCVGLPETQSSIGIDDTKLHKTAFRQHMWGFAGIKLDFYIKQAQTHRQCSYLVFAHSRKPSLPPGDLDSAQIMFRNTSTASLVQAPIT